MCLYLNEFREPIEATSDVAVYQLGKVIDDTFRCIWKDTYTKGETTEHRDITPVENNKKYNKTAELEVKGGYYSWIDHKLMPLKFYRQIASARATTYVIKRFYIPKGTKYYLDLDGQVKSEQLIYR